jgi:flagellar motor switch protein FliM
MSTELINQLRMKLNDDHIQRRFLSEQIKTNTKIHKQFCEYTLFGNILKLDIVLVPPK